MVGFQLPDGFKIRNKSDAFVFAYIYMSDNSVLYLQGNDKNWYHLSKECGVLKLATKRGMNRSDYLNSDVIVAVSGKNSSKYEITIEDWLWKNRKSINKQLFDA